MSKRELEHEVRDLFLLALLEQKEYFIHEIWKNYILGQKGNYQQWLKSIFPSRDALNKTKYRLDEKQYISIRPHLEKGQRSQVYRELCAPTPTGRVWVKTKLSDFVQQAPGTLRDQYYSTTQSSAYNYTHSLPILAHILSDLLSSG